LTGKAPYKFESISSRVRTQPRFNAFLDLLAVLVCPDRYMLGAARSLQELNALAAAV
jgi:hypothetical protein